MRAFERSEARCFVALCAAFACLVPQSALAQSAPGLDLRWQAPASCPQQGDVRERVAKLTGSSNASAGLLQAEGVISQTDSEHFHLRLVTRSGKLVGERTLDSSSCVDLAGAAAVTLALLMRSEAPLRDRDHGDPPQSGTAAAPPSSLTGGTAAPKEPGNPANNEAPTASKAGGAERPRNANEMSARAWRVVVQAPVPALSIGPLPKPIWGIGLGAGVGYQHWRFLLEGTDWRRQTVPAQDFPGDAAEVDRTTVALRACHTRRFSAFEVAPCLLVSLEHISARGSGPNVTPRSERTTWLGVGGGAEARLYVARWFSVFMGADAQIETARPRISIGGVGEVGQLGPAAFTVMVGPEWIL